MTASTSALYPTPRQTSQVFTESREAVNTETQLYRNTGTQQTASDFFSPLPRAIWILVEQGRIERRDASLLGVLLDYKNRTKTTVSPCQATLARRLGCSVDTIQRGLCRLVKAGLIAKKRIRDAAGRLGRLAYDLAAVLSFMPHHAAKMRSGEWGSQDGEARPLPIEKAGPEPRSTMPQKCGIEADLKAVVKADNSQTPPAALPISPVALQLIDLGVIRRAAIALVEKYGEERCCKVLTDMKQRSRIRDKAAWIVGCLAGGWKFPTAAVAPAPYPIPKKAAPAVETTVDPLAQLTAAELTALEQTARAQLIAETKDPVQGLLKQGRETRLVKSRMRLLLSTALGN